ncbi:MAG TPA: ScpA family protein [Patescibacteria group bacterium]|nr:ScpA family protein [Patescibacteria group bacterium]
MSEAESPKFEEDVLKDRLESEQLLLYLGGFDGPIDMLLTLARDQKVDLAKISILSLANQYLEFVQKAQSLRLELAADYLVMAAWLAYLKSRLLIPVEELKQAEPTAQEIADALQFQLRRLEAMRKTADELFRLPRLGYNIFARGEPDGLPVQYISKYDMTYYDLLKAYGDVKQRQQNSVYKLNPVKLFTLEEAISRMENMMGKIPQEWVSLFMFLPGGLKDRIVKRSAIASTFGGALEMCKRGMIQIQQEKNYAPIFIRKPVNQDAVNENIEMPEETPIDRSELAESEALEEIAAAEEAAAAEAKAAAEAEEAGETAAVEAEAEEEVISEEIFDEEIVTDEALVEEAESAEEEFASDEDDARKEGA